MKRRAAAAVARDVNASRGPIGFAVRDLTGRGCAFEIDQAAGEALVFGTSSPLRVSARGVLPAHFVVLPHDGKLVAASASAATPAILNGSPLPTTWTVLEVPSRIRAGAAAVDFFFIRESGVVLVDQDVETTVADPGASSGTARLRLVTPARPLPPMLPPPMRGAKRLAIPHNPVLTVTEPEMETETAPNLAFAGPGTSGLRIPPVSPVHRAREVALASYAQVSSHWTNAPMSTRVLLGVVAVLVIFLVARTGQEPRSTAPTGEAASSSTSVQVVPTGVPTPPVTVVPMATAQ